MAFGHDKDKDEDEKAEAERVENERQLRAAAKADNQPKGVSGPKTAAQPQGEGPNDGKEDERLAQAEATSGVTLQVRDEVTDEVTYTNIPIEDLPRDNLKLVTKDDGSLLRADPA